MNKIFLCLFCLVSLLACKEKKNNADKDTTYFPVLSFLKGQVRHIDTSLYRIVKVETTGGISDTAYIPREKFETCAKDFLSIPDISSEKWKAGYKEDKMYDDVLKNVILTYSTTEADNEIKREDVILEPNANGNSDVKTIIITKWLSNADSTIEQNMVWYVNKRFTVVTKIQKANSPEKIKTVQVIWNDFINQQ